MGNVIGLVPSRTGIAIGRLVNAPLRACVICLAPSMHAARRHKSFLFWPQIQCRKPVKNYYCISDISRLHQGDRLKTAVLCFTEPL